MRSQLIVLTAAVKETCAFHIAIPTICFHIHILIFTHSNYGLPNDFVAVPERPCSAKEKTTTKNEIRKIFDSILGVKSNTWHNVCVCVLGYCILRRMCADERRIQYFYKSFLPFSSPEKTHSWQPKIKTMYARNGNKIDTRASISADTQFLRTGRWMMCFVYMTPPPPRTAFLTKKCTDKNETALSQCYFHEMMQFSRKIHRHFRFR